MALSWVLHNKPVYLCKFSFCEVKAVKTAYVFRYLLRTACADKHSSNSLALSEGFGIEVFSPLYQGFLTSKYLKGIPADMLDDYVRYYNA